MALFPQESRKTKYAGKIAAIGQGGSGKTFLTNQLANHLAGKQLYSWDEEANMAGTIGVTPYTLDFPGNKRLVVNDNPGQDSLDLVRQAMASQGDVYQGLLIVTDSLGWNFRNIGVYQAITMRGHAKVEDLPVSVVVSKRDLCELLSQPTMMTELAEQVVAAVDTIRDGVWLEYNDRVFRGRRKTQVKMDNPELIPLTAVEQVATNALDNWLFKRPIPGFTPMNVRLLVRSLLLGYCEFMLQIEPDIATKHPSFNAINTELKNRLNYHRPTAFETGTGWEKLGRGMNEPPVVRRTMTVANVKTMLGRFVLASEVKIKQFVDEVQALELEKNWHLVSHTFTDSVSNEGRERVKHTLEQLMVAMEGQLATKVETPTSVADLGLEEF